jgi:hypothetical protein
MMTVGVNIAAHFVWSHVASLAVPRWHRRYGRGKFAPSTPRLGIVVWRVLLLRLVQMYVYPLQSIYVRIKLSLILLQYI